MAQLTDPVRLLKFKEALSNWQYSGYINYSRMSDAWIRGNLTKCNLLTIGKLLYEYFVDKGGHIDEVAETREEWKDKWDYHHDLRPLFRGKLLYVETRLCYNPFEFDKEPTIFVANVHWA